MADQNLKVTLSAVDKTRQAFASVRTGLGRIGRSVANVRTALVGLGATVALKQFATQIDNLAKASSRLGLTVNQIQSLQFAASQRQAAEKRMIEHQEAQNTTWIDVQFLKQVSLVFFH